MNGLSTVVYKQKEAYGKRISDWSSDVCSSDLERQYLEFLGPSSIPLLDLLPGDQDFGSHRIELNDYPAFTSKEIKNAILTRKELAILQKIKEGLSNREIALKHRISEDTVKWHVRSEEHTSKLQSLMRISNAVFCLKKKKKK